ncbi:MAG: Ser-Thr-rich GPI-anchored membrane family protein [Acidobacteriota bacterium]
MKRGIRRGVLRSLRRTQVVWLAITTLLLTTFLLSGMACASPSSTVRYIPVLKNGTGLQMRIDLFNDQKTPVSVRIFAVDSKGETSEPAGGEVQLEPYGAWILESHQIPATAEFLKIVSEGTIRATAVLTSKVGGRSEAITASDTSTTLDFSFFSGSEFLSGSLFLVNPNPVNAPVELAASDAAGTTLGKNGLPALAPYESRQIALDELFGAEILESVSTLRVKSRETVAGFRLSDSSDSDLVGLPALGDAALSWMFYLPRFMDKVAVQTTVGIQNGGDATATLTVESFDKDGNPAGNAEGIRLNPKAVLFLNDSDKEAISASAAYVKVTSDQPVKGFALFATAMGRGQAAALGVPNDDALTPSICLTGRKNGSVLKVMPVSGTQRSLGDIGRSLAPTITLTAPNGGQVWGASNRYTITWNSSQGAGSYVDIDLYKGGYWNRTIATGLWIGSNSCTWLVPYNQTTGNDYKVRVRSNTGVEDYSNGDFTIKKSTITVTSPVGGERWELGTAHTIQWNYSGDPGSTVDIDLYKKGSWVRTIGTRIPIGYSNSGSYLWTVQHAITPSSDYKIRIRSNRGIEDFSNTNFVITPSGVTVTAPNSSAVEWRLGTKPTIRWTHKTNAGSYVDIDLYKGEGWNRTIAVRAPIGEATGATYSWVVPSDVVPGNDYKVRLRTEWGFTDFSNEAFSIQGTGIGVTSPAWPPPTVPASTRLSIAWSYQPYAGYSVEIDLYKGGSWVRNIATGASIGSGGVGSLSWLIPTDVAPGIDYSIRLRTDWGFQDFTDHDFQISETGFAVYQPNGGGSYAKGTPIYITWSTLNELGEYVVIDLYKGEYWNRTIATGLWFGSGGDGFRWLIPSDITPGSDYKVRVTTTDTGVTDYSDYPFGIHD